MKRLALVALIAWLVALLVGPPGAWAQMYRYKDEKGDTFIVQGLDDVPERYRRFAKPLTSPFDEATHPACMAAADAPPGGAKIRFKPNPAGRIFVWACVNGRGPVLLILDTGAPFTMIDPDALKGVGVDFRDAKTIALRGITPQVGTAELVRVESLEVAGARVRVLFVAARRLGWGEPVGGIEVAGLLGQDFLKEFDVDVDYQRGIVFLTPKDRAVRGKMAAPKRERADKQRQTPKP